MISRRLALLLLLAATKIPAAWAADLGRGRLLYDIFCYQCHVTEIHYRVGSKVDSWEGLQRTVTVWQAAMGLGWNREDIGDVAGYLNERFYRFQGSGPRQD